MIRDAAAVVGLLLTAVGSLILIGRWTGGIDEKLVDVTHQIEESNRRIAAAEDAARAASDAARAASESARIASSRVAKSKQTQSQMNRIEAAVDNLHFRVSQIEDSLKKRPR